MENETEFISVKNGAKYLGVDQRTLYVYIKQGRLNKYKRLGKAYVKKAELDVLREFTLVESENQGS